MEDDPTETHLRLFSNPRGIRNHLPQPYPIETKHRITVQLSTASSSSTTYNMIPPLSPVSVSESPF